MVNTDAQFDIKFKIEENYLLVSANGKYTLTKATNLFKDAIDNGVLQSKGRLIIDVMGVTGSIPFFDRYEYSKFLAEYCIKNAVGKIYKIAVVGKEPIVHKERFGELVAVNRGANVGVFTDMNEASIWLNKE